MRSIVNYAGFQLGWFLLVLTQSPWALIWVAGFVFIHARWFARTGEWRLVVAIALFGLVIDSLWQLSPWVEFNGLGQPIPLWLLGLWLSFPLTLFHSLGWLKHRVILQILCGAFGGGGSYIAGAQLGAADMAPIAYVLMPLTWSIWLVVFYQVPVWLQRSNRGLTV